MNRGIVHIIIFLLILVYPVNATNLPQKSVHFYSSGLIKHPVHISFTNVEYNQKEKKFEILFKFFVDDFDLILKLKYGKELNLAGGRWEKTYSEFVGNYILEHFKLFIGGKDKTKSSLKFVKKQINENSIWLYYDFNTKEKSNTFEVYNSFMTDLYYDQHNLLIFTYMDQQKAVKLNYTTRKETFSF